MLRGRKNVIMTCTNKCEGMCKLNVVLNMEILLHLINRLLLEQAWHEICGVNRANEPYCTNQQISRGHEVC